MKWGAVLIVAALLLAFGCAGRTTRAAGKKMIVLGVDGMDPVFVETHLASLPNLNHLRQTGAFKRLATTVPPQSPVAWSSVITGMDPGGHGIFDFVHRNPSTRMPVSSMAETTEPTRTFGLGPYLIPLSGGGVRTLRAGRAFWQVLQERGVNSNIVRMPANFPPAECESDSLAGMGTPDMTGSFGTFSFYTDDPAERRDKVPGGQIMQVATRNGRVELSVPGPPNQMRRDHQTTSATLIVSVDAAGQAARFDTGGQQFILQSGDWSGWVKAEYALIPHVNSVRGIFRVYLQQLRPYLRVYVSPVNIDPEAPVLPISTPHQHSRDLSDSVGPFYTQGIAEETSAFRAGIFSKAEFLTQSRKVLSDSLKLFRHELDRFQDGLFFYYFSSVDQNSHMLWGRHEDDLLEIYVAVDQAIGLAMAKAGTDTPLMVISDHGFAPFNRAVHLNSFLMREGFLVLDDPAKVGDEELFAHVDWSKSVAYAIGLNGIYVNQDGRESSGIVPAADKRQVLDKLAGALANFKDPVTGEQVVERVYFPEHEFAGRNLKYSPDLLVGFRRGYRASWQTALGAVPRDVMEDNTQAWIGDHCMAADQVPGVLFSNRAVRAASPHLWDITATILGEFGVAKTSGMIGQSVF
ncbi:MAG: alkaline phosphatase family protein [Candidatus Solibacter sp.]